MSAGKCLQERRGGRSRPAFVLHEGRNAVACKDKKSGGRKGSASADADTRLGRKRPASAASARPSRGARRGRRLIGGMQVQGGKKKGRPEPPHKSCWEGNILKKTRRKGVPVGKVHCLQR